MFLVLNLVLVIFLRFFGNNKYRDKTWRVAAYFAWLIANMQLLQQLIETENTTAR